MRKLLDVFYVYRIMLKIHVKFYKYFMIKQLKQGI